MLDKIMGNAGMVKEIYRGDTKVWEMPMCMIDVNKPSIGHTTIIGKTYPGRCEVIVKLQRQEVSRINSSPTGVFAVSLPRELKEGDRLNFSASKSGWETNSYMFFV